MELSKNDYINILTFMKRSQLTGEEAGIFYTLYGKILKIIQEGENEQFNKNSDNVCDR